MSRGVLIAGLGALVREAPDQGAQGRGRRRLIAGAVAGLLVAGTSAAIAAPYRSTLPAGSPEAPLLHGEVLPGQVTTTPAAAQPVSAKTADGLIGDWTGAGTRMAGTAVYSRGEYVYTDHLFDALGADDGKDAERNETTDPLNEAAPETYRVEAVYQADVAGQLGAPTPDQLKAKEHYGDLPRVDQADISETRVGLTPDGAGVALLVRTTTMKPGAEPGVLVLIDRDGELSNTTAVPFNSGLRTNAADMAVLLAPGASRAMDLATGAVTSIDAAFNSDGYDNAVETVLPRSWFGDGALRLAVMAGALADGKLANVANVAFRFDEPVRIYWDKMQAYALAGGEVDKYITAIDTQRLADGGTDHVALGPGYYDRVFTSSELASSEGGEEGRLQHYGVWVPTGYEPGTESPATFWMHWRGGRAHSAAVLAPRIMRDFGESRGNLVFSPRGRGTSSWYEGKGHIDFNEVWNDAMTSFSVNANRVYLSGHSMGGWASYFLASVYPDRFAATMPVEGTVTQGAYVSPVDDKCDQCYIQTNNGDAKALHTYKILDNLRNTPIAIYQGLIDELVPETGTLLQVRKLQDLGYRYRFYQFFQYEHYTHPIMDEWTAGAAYMDRFTRDPNPARVTYVRDMPFERAAETGPDQRAGRQFQGLDLCFCSAYWMSGLTAVDGVNGQARFDGTNLAKPVGPTVAAPDTDAPVAVGQTGPYAVVGQQWLAVPGSAPAAVNGFSITLTGASAVTLDLDRMGIDPAQPIMATVSSTHPVWVTLMSSAGVRRVGFGPGQSQRTL